MAQITQQDANQAIRVGIKVAAAKGSPDRGPWYPSAASGRLRSARPSESAAPEPSRSLDQRKHDNSPPQVDVNPAKRI